MAQNRLRFWIAIAVIWIGAWISYSNSFTIAFQFDDTHTVQSNMYVRSLKYIPRYFVDSTTYSYRPENSGYRPMTSVALALGFAISHLETWGYHVIKLIEHCVLACLIMILGLRLLPRGGLAAAYRFWIAFFGGLVFAVHRANTETVDYICAVSTLQAGLFHALGFYLYLRAREQESSRRRALLIGLSSFVYLCSMWSKEEGVTLPATIFLYEWIYGRTENETYLGRLRSNFSRFLRIVAPYLGVMVLFVTLRTVIQPGVADASRGNMPMFYYAITQFRSWLHYWILFFWPVHLNADNLSFEFSLSLADARVWAAIAAHAAIWALAWMVGKRRRFVLFAVAWAYVTVLPASSVFVLVEAVNEHRMYIPYVLLAPLAVWSVVTLFLGLAQKIQVPKESMSKVAFVSLAIWCVALGVGTYERNKVWQTDVSLWEDVYSKNPRSPRAMNVLSASLLNRGDVARSVPLLEECHRIVPSYLPCIVHLSIAYAHFKRFNEGLALLKQGNQIDPNYVHINYHLGTYYKDYFGDFEPARAHLSRAHEVSQGRFFQATLKLADLELEEGKVQEGIQRATSVLQIDMSNGDAWEVYARGLMLSGNLNAAADIFQKLIHSSPHAIRYLLGLANVSERRGDIRSAYDGFLSVVKKSPESIQAWSGLSRAAKKIGDMAMAKNADAQVEALRGSNHWVWYASAFLVGEKRRQVAP